MVDFLEQKIQADVLEKIEELASQLTPDTHEATDDLLKLLAANERWIGPSRMGHFLKLVKKSTGIALEWVRGAIRTHQRAEREERASRESARLITTDAGKPLPIEANVVTLMRTHEDLRGLFALDEFRQRGVVTRKPPWEKGGVERYPRDVTDVDVVELVLWMQHREVHLRGLSPAKSALITVTQDCKFHPVRDYLDGVEWDGRPRLANMLHDYLGVKPIPGYTDKVGLKWMVSAVARVMRPGCTAKYVLTLLGPQDLGKSTVFRVLGGEHFTDDVAQLGTKDSSLQIGNAWIIELAELDSTARAEQSTIKAFISREVDRFRPPYGTHVVEQKRECILCATVNPSGKIFKDETGAVRFWGVTCTAVDIVSLRRDRDQLWAEAAHLYRAGEAWWFTDEEEESTALAREQQAEHSEMVQDHPWTDLLSEWLAEREAEVDEEVERYRVAGRELDWGDVEGHVDLGDARCRVRRSDGTLVFQIYEALEALGVERKHMNSPHVWRQVSKILMDLGWRSGSVDRACCPTGKQERVRRWQRVAVIEELEAPGGGEGAGSAGEGGAEREPGEDEDDGYEEDDGRHEQ